MLRTIVAFACLLSNICFWAADEKQPSYPTFDDDAARAHELKPHRRTIPLEGVRPGFNELRITLTVSPTGDVVDAKPGGLPDVVKFWPQVQPEVLKWKFTPFEEKGKAVAAQIDEYVGLVPPERLPQRHVAAPALRLDSQIGITLSRTGCFGRCPAYSVAITTDGIVFDGQLFVVAYGRHTDRVDANEVRRLVKKFVAADFYSMDPVYRAEMTDSPTYELTLAMDGQTKTVEDYVGSWVGMPSVIIELENDVDTLARTQRWIDGSEGLIQTLQAEKFNFQSYQGQAMLKEAAGRGNIATMKELLKAGVPLEPLPAPQPNQLYMTASYAAVGWLNAASSHLEALQFLMDAGASKNDQSDKDLALAGLVRSGNVEAVRALIAYGAKAIALGTQSTGVCIHRL